MNYLNYLISLAEKHSPQGYVRLSKRGLHVIDRRDKHLRPKEKARVLAQFAEDVYTQKFFADPTYDPLNRNSPQAGGNRTIRQGQIVDQDKAKRGTRVDVTIGKKGPIAYDRGKLSFNDYINHLVYMAENETENKRSIARTLISNKKLSEDTDTKWRRKAEKWNDHDENKRMGRFARMSHPAHPHQDNSFGSAKYRQSQGYVTR